MDDDLYNALDNEDIFGQETGIRPDDGGDNESRLFNELNNRSRRAPKRPLTFDACDALDWHMHVPCTFEEIEGKRQKKEHDELVLNRLTQRILLARRRLDISVETDEDPVIKKCSKEQITILKFPPIDGTPWITISSVDCSRRFYLRLKKSHTKQHGRGCEKARFEQSSSIVLKARESLDNDYADRSKLTDNLPVINTEAGHEKLWVDKYAPHTFADLVSDDRINRLLLNWIKAWDLCVFKKPVPEFYDSTEVFGLDDGYLRRPKYKVALIAGPAGTGKTTLATVIAQQAGYSIAEVNASDDRNVADFEKRIEEAVRTVKTLDVDSKPICLLLDEIDGTPIESIRLLCKVVNKTGKKCIRRPIICICNNLYTPSLRELRSVALVFQMPFPDEERLIKRLRQIAELEEIRVDSSALPTLVSICGLDLRSCINGLQYLAARFASCVIDSQIVVKYGNSDRQYTERTLFDAWSCVLEQKNHVDHRGKLGSLRDRAHRVSTVTERLSGDANRFFAGLFANYLSSAVGPSGIFLVQKVINWFCDFDMLMSFVNHSCNHTFMKYTFVISVMIHFLICAVGRLQLVYPSVEQAFKQKRKQSLETLQCLKSNIVLATVNDRMLVLNFLPLFIIIVQPPIKQANAQLFSDREMKLFQNVIATMCFYSVTFKPTFQSGNTVFSFFPPLDLIALFPLDDTEEEYGRLVPLTKSAKQMIAHQIEFANLRNSSVFPDNSDGENQSKEPTILEKPTSTYLVSVKSKKNDLVYHYNQGFSNAIRRNIRMRNLIFDN